MIKQVLVRLTKILLPGISLSGCALYRPMQCAAPALYERGQVELAGSAYFNKRLNGAVNYSPPHHELERAAIDGKADRDDSTYVRSRQYELAVGTYWQLGKQIVLGGLLGAGQARS
ncbi:MAG: hypothetical protein ACRYFV_08550 [Janthinobacterium lividum]